MAQLPGRISIRPLAKFVNKPKTHAVSLQNKKMQVDVKYEYQTLRNQIDYSDIQEIKVDMSDRLQQDPLSRTVKIRTKKRQYFEIPEMDSYKAIKLKEAIEMQKLKAKKIREQIQNKSSASRVVPIARYRR